MYMSVGGCLLGYVDCKCVPVSVSGEGRWLCVTEHACEYCGEQRCLVVCLGLGWWGVRV